MSNIDNFINNTEKAVDNLNNFDSNGFLNLNGQTFNVVKQILSKGFQAAHADIIHLTDRTSTIESLLDIKNIVINDFVGNGEDYQFIELSFVPKLVIVTYQGKFTTYYSYYDLVQYYGGIATKDVCALDSNKNPIVEIVNNEKGFYVYRDSDSKAPRNDSNMRNTRYTYIAIG